MAKATSTPNIDIALEVQKAATALAPAAKRLQTALGKLKPEKLPLGAAADLLYDLRQVSRLVPNLTAPFDDVLVPHIKALEEYFVNQLKVGEASGVQGMHSRVQVTSSAVPTLEDKVKFYAYVKKNNAFDLLNQSLNRLAVQARWDDKKQVPGVGVFLAKKVSCTKLSGKKGK